ncbi:hypothetical protein BH10ACI3_BH10ACI3_27390 [soil metagenome]
MTAVIAAASFAALAQDGPSPGRMFVGETLVYDGKVSKLKVGISVADLTFTALGNPESDGLIVKTSAVSKGTLLSWFHYSFLQEYESTIALGNFRILKTTKHDVQKQRVRDSEALFDYTDKRVTYVETDPKDKNRPPRRIASEITEPMNDMISGIYYVRMAPLAVGKKFEVQVSDSGLVYKVPVVVTGREKLKTAIGKVWCFIVEPQIFGHDRLIEQKGRMVIWITEDARRLPVKAAINTQFGKVEVKLKSVTNSK